MIPQNGDWSKPDPVAHTSLIRLTGMGFPCLYDWTASWGVIRIAWLSLSLGTFLHVCRETINPVSRHEIPIILDLFQ